ncbi:MAG: 30S ribosomal protein S6e [archaeon]
MVDVRLVVGNPSTKKTHQKMLSPAETGKLANLKIGSKLKGEAFGLPGYELVITGGSDRDGFPMRKGIPGVGKHKPILSGGVGFHPKKDGERRKITVHSENIDQIIAQVNVKVLKIGEKPLEELIPAGEKKKEGK